MHRTLLLTATVGLLATGLAVAEPKSDAPDADTVELAPHIAPLFELEREWRFEVTTSSGFWDDSDPAADDGGMVRSSETSTATCRVAERHDFGKAGLVSQIVCEGADLEPLAGNWIARPDALYRAPELPADAAAVDAAVRSGDRILALPTEAIEHKNENDEGMGEMRVVSASGAGWCVERSWWGGDEAGQDLCLTPDGPQSGRTWWAGGGEQETSFERVVETARVAPPVKPFGVDPYAAWLFEADTEWTFDVEHFTAWWDDRDPKANKKGMVESIRRSKATCRVAEVRQFGADGVASRITCDDDADLRPLIGGIWMATLDGLTRREAAPDLALPADASELAAYLEAGEPFLSSSPKKTTRSDTNGDGHTRTISVFPVADGWCVEDFFAGGDESHVQLCLTPKGPMSGQHGWSGGTIHETRYQLAPDP